MKWQDKLIQFVAYYQEHSDPPDPCLIYDPQPPAECVWPSKLPCNDEIREFYKVCGGGEFGLMLRFIPVCDLLEQTNHWVKILSGYDERGDIIQTGRHVVFANDADGTPWIWDSKTGVVASFYWKGGDWEEPEFASFGNFMEYVFTPEEDDDSWRNSLQIIIKKNA